MILRGESFMKKNETSMKAFQAQILCSATLGLIVTEERETNNAKSKN